MSGAGELRVSEHGQMSLPAETRHRWGLDDGGEIGYLDVGDAIVLVPGSSEPLRHTMLDAIADTDWQNAREGFGDQDLANE